MDVYLFWVNIGANDLKNYFLLHKLKIEIKKKKFFDRQGQ